MGLGPQDVAADGLVIKGKDEGVGTIALRLAIGICQTALEGDERGCGSQGNEGGTQRQRQEATGNQAVPPSGSDRDHGWSRPVLS